MKRVLILGSAGYIGSRLMSEYKGTYDLCGVDIGWYDGGFVDIVEDYNNLSAEFIQEFDAVVLLAGHSSVKMCEGDMQSAYNNNVRNFQNIINKMKANQKLIYASSSSVYGMVGADAVDEGYISFTPHNDYDVTKHIIDVLAQRSNVQFYGLRFGTVNGYSPKVRSDVMINSMTYSAKTSGEIKLYIKDIIRPILGTNDLSRAIQCIIDSDEDNRGLYNVASFSGTAESIANAVSEVSGVGITHYQSDPNNILNAKLETKCYDFDIDCTKFKQTYNFTFKDTAKSLTSELLLSFDSIIFNNRNLHKNYE